MILYKIEIRLYLIGIKSIQGDGVKMNELFLQFYFFTFLLLLLFVFSFIIELYFYTEKPLQLNYFCISSALNLLFSVFSIGKNMRVTQLLKYMPRKRYVHPHSNELQKYVEMYFTLLYTMLRSFS